MIALIRKAQVVFLLLYHTFTLRVKIDGDIRVPFPLRLRGASSARVKQQRSNSN